MQSYYRRYTFVNRYAIFFCSVSTFFLFWYSPTNDTRTHTRIIFAHTYIYASVICLSSRKSSISVYRNLPSVSTELIFQCLILK